MTLIDNATLELDAQVLTDGPTVPESAGVFEFETDVEMNYRMRTSYLLDNSLDRILGALQLDESTPKRSGVTIDVGGGEMLYTLSFTESSGGTNSWGDEGGDPKEDATGDSARRKAEVLMRYVRTGKFDSNQPARLQFGEHNRDGGVYEPFTNVGIKDIDITVSSESEDTIEGSITLVEVGELGGEKTTRVGF